MAMVSQAPAPSQQLGAPFSDPLTWHDYLHGEQHATVLVWHPETPGHNNTKIEPDSAPFGSDFILTQLGGHEEIFATPNEFAGWRKRGLLRSLRAFWVDIDNSQAEPKRLLAAKLDHLARNKCPQPTMVVYSGGGIHLYWVLAQPVSSGYLPTWRKVERQLARLLGGDLQATDCTRLLRLPGTINGKRGGVEVEGQIVTGEKVEFNHIRDAVSPLGECEEEEKKKKSGGKKKKKKSGRKKKKKKGKNGNSGRKDSTLLPPPPIGEWYEGVYRDIFTITHNHWPQGAPNGYRNNVLFPACVALSAFHHPYTLEKEIAATARQLTPTLTREEVVETTSTLVKKMKSGEGPYSYRRTELRSYLGDLITPEIEPKLGYLVSDDELRRREKESQQRWRRKVGVRTREQYLEKVRQGSNEQNKPWEKLGIGRRTWYKRGKPDPNSYYGCPAAPHPHIKKKKSND